MSLEKFQKDFIEALYQKENTLLDSYLEDDHIGTAQRLAVYENNLHVTLRQNLLNHYPKTARVVDERFFHFAADSYIKEHRSFSGNLDDFGSSFPRFLAEFEPCKAFPFISEVARFEHLHHESYLSADSQEEFDAEGFGEAVGVHTAQLHIALSPNLRLFRSAYHILPLIELEKNAELPENFTINQSSFLVISRPDYKILYHTLTKAAWHFLEALQNDASLSGATKVAKEHDEHFNLAQNLDDFMGQRFFDDFFIDDLG